MVYSTARRELARRMEQTEPSLEQEVRCLLVQYHLIPSLQQHFLSARAHKVVRAVPALGDALFDAAMSAQEHFALVRRRLGAPRRRTIGRPFEVELWQAYLRSNREVRPFVGLGAIGVLEALAAAAQARFDSTSSGEDPRLWVGDFAEGRFTLAPGSPSGEAVLTALEAADLSAAHRADLYEGTVKGAVLALRMIEWAMAAETASALQDAVIGV